MKKAVIIGGSTGLGHELIVKLLEENTFIVNVSRTFSPLATQNITTDLTKQQDIDSAINTISNSHTDIDLLILCAGVMHNHKVGEYSISEINEEFAVNSTGAIQFANSLMKYVAQNKGDVVIVGSTASFTANGDNAVYVAAKHAVLGFTRSLQAQYKKDNVRIIGFYPGGFQSPFHIKAKSNLKQEDLMNPKDLAGLIMYSLTLPRNIEVSEMIVNRKKA